MEKQTGSKLGEEYVKAASYCHPAYLTYTQSASCEMQGCILAPCLFNFYTEYIIWNARLDEALTGIKVARRNTNNLKYAYDTTLMAES